MSTGSAGGPERSWAAWSGGWSRSAVTVLRRRGGCRGALRVPPFLFAAVAWGARGGSSPGGDPLVAAGHAFPSPCPVAVRASSDDDCGSVVPGRRIVSFPQGGEPVLPAPPGCVGRVHGDHVQPGVGCHLDQAVTEPGGGQACDDRPEPPAPDSPGRPAASAFPALLAGVSEVQVLYRDRLAAVLAGHGDQGGDGGPDPSVPLRRREASQCEGDCVPGGRRGCRRG